jgi:hypothetical protein
MEFKLQALVVRVKNGETEKGTDGAENTFPPPVNPLLYSPSASIYNASSMELIDSFWKWVRA